MEIKWNKNKQYFHILKIKNIFKEENNMNIKPEKAFCENEIERLTKILFNVDSEKAKFIENMIRHYMLILQTY